MLEIICGYQNYRRNRISSPAATASTARTVVIVDETRTLSKGKSPVRISQIPSSSIPRFLPAKVLVNAIGSSLVCIEFQFGCSQYHLAVAGGTDCIQERFEQVLQPGFLCAKVNSGQSTICCGVVSRIFESTEVWQRVLSCRATSNSRAPSNVAYAAYRAQIAGRRSSRR